MQARNESYQARKGSAPVPGVRTIQSKSARKRLTTSGGLLAIGYSTKTSAANMKEATDMQRLCHRCSDHAQYSGWQVGRS